MGETMRTLGVDLASDTQRTACCALEWGEAGVQVARLWADVGDDDLVSEHSQAAATGIDSPFGWPASFLTFLCGTSRLLAGPAPDWSNTYRDSLRFRTTDFRVQGLTKHWPLSVSSDLIAVPAMRCQGLLMRMGVSDRSGDGRVFEVYPAAALNQWGLPFRKYKGVSGGAVRKGLIEELVTRAPWLELNAEHLTQLRDSDDALDALVASLNARAAWLGLTLKPTDEERHAAVREGWIAVPVGKDSFDRLVDV
jgi:predicted nuclease with RNAse H fold